MEEFKSWIEINQLTEDPWFTDTFYLRFCRARKFDLEKVKAMFSEYLTEYREPYRIDNILEVSIMVL